MEPDAEAEPMPAIKGPVIGSVLTRIVFRASLASQLPPTEIPTLNTINNQIQIALEQLQPDDGLFEVSVSSERLDK